jgi:hypothetical protein
MALRFPGTTQVNGPGSAKLITAFPFTIAWNFKLSTNATFQGIMADGNGASANGWEMELSGQNFAGSLENTIVSTSSNPFSSTGVWYTAIFVARDTTHQDYYVYNHATHSLVTAAGTATLTAPNATTGQIYVGAGNEGGAVDQGTYDMSWIAVFSSDKGRAGTISPEIRDLINNGFWNQLDKNCQMALEFNSGAIRDLSQRALGYSLGTPASFTFVPGHPTGNRPASPVIWIPTASGGTITAPASTATGKVSTQSANQATRSLTSSAFARAAASSTLAAIKAMTSVILGKASTSSALKATKAVTSTPTGRAATTTQLSATKAVTSQGKGAAATTTGQMTATKAVLGSSAGKAGTSSQLAATKPMAASASSGKARTTTIAVTRTVTLVSTVQGRGATTVSATVTRSVTSASAGRASTTASFTITKAVSSTAPGRARTQSAFAVTVVLPASISRGQSSTVSAGVVGTGGGTVQAPPSISRGSARVVSSCTVTRTMSGQVQGRSIVSQSRVNVTRTMTASTSKGLAQVAASIAVSRTFTTRAAGRAFTLSSVSVTRSIQVVAGGQSRVVTGQIQVSKQLASAVRARAFLTSGVTLQQVLAGYSQGRASTISSFTIIPLISNLPPPTPYTRFEIGSGSSRTRATVAVAGTRAAVENAYTKVKIESD